MTEGRATPALTREMASLQGLLLALSPLALILPAHPGPPVVPGFSPEVAFGLGVVAHGAAALGLLAGAATLPSSPAGSRTVATGSVVLLAILQIVAWWSAPTVAFLVLLGCGALLARLWPLSDPRGERPADLQESTSAAATAAAGATLLAWWVAVPLEWGASPGGVGPAALTALLGTLLASEASRHDDLPVASRRAWYWLTVTSLALGALSLALLPLLAVTFFALPPVARLALARVPAERLADLRALWSAALVQPARALLVGFCGLSLLGGILLSLPVASGHDRPVAFVDALFTAVSATCVTGLVVVDTPHDFSLFGQAVILALCQVGGLGIMTFSAAAVALLGVRASVRYESTVAGLLGAKGIADLQDALWRMFLLTVAAEAVGALFLAVAFGIGGDPAPVAAWRGLFTAVSAFCNAGFALQTESLLPYQQQGSILLVVSGLVVIGGLGPAAVWAIPRWLRGQRVSLAPKLALATSATLLALGTVLIAAVEWDNALAGLSPWDRLVNAWFQSVTLRTAGFASMDLGGCAPATWLVMVVWMFIGGSPGSTAGGVKTTTVAVLVMAVLASLRGRPEAIGFGRRVSHRSVYQAAAIATAGLGAGGVVLLGLLLTQDLPLTVAIFETTSALGTVGLSLGGTTMLDDVGKFLVMGGMLVGRVGPLTLFLFLTSRSVDRPSGLPEEPVVVG